MRIRQELKADSTRSAKFLLERSREKEEKGGKGDEWRNGKVLVDLVCRNKFEYYCIQLLIQNLHHRSSLTEDPRIAHEHGRTLPNPEHSPAYASIAHFVAWTTGPSARLQEQIQGHLDLVITEFCVVFPRQVLEQARRSRADERESGQEETPVPEHFRGPHGLLGARPREDANDGGCRQGCL